MTDSDDWQLEPILECLAEGAGFSMEVLRNDPVNGGNSKAIYDSVMKKEGCELKVDNRLFDEIFEEVVQDERFLLDPSEFGKSNYYDLADFLTSRLRSKFLTFERWVTHKSFPSDIEIISFPSSQPYAYVKYFNGRHLIVIHYGLTQLLEFTAETGLIHKWIDDLKNSGGMFASGFPLLKEQLELFFVYRMALGNYVQKEPLLLPGMATVLPIPYLLELISRVGFGELFVCAHEHVHVVEKHFSRAAPKEHSFHGSMGRDRRILTDDQKLELATDLMALPYFSAKGWTGALDGISTYFLALGQHSVMFGSPSRSHPPILHRIDNLLSEMVGIAPASLMPVKLYQVRETVEKLETTQKEKTDFDESADWPRVISEYTDMATKIAKLLVMSEISRHQ